MSAVISSHESAVVVLRSDESKELIGRAVAALPQVQSRMRQGRMVIVGGTTTRMVAKHLLGEDPGHDPFAVGWIKAGALGESPKEGRGPGPYLFEQGAVSRGWPAPLLERFEAGDVYIKGGNALDPAGHAGVLMGSPTGGTIGLALAILMARGGELIVPISLQKQIPSVAQACRLLGQGKSGRVMGSPVGLMPIMAGTARLVTEVEAFQILAQVTATLVAAGGVDDCRGALVFHLAGTVEAVTAAWNLVEAIRQQI